MNVEQLRALHNTTDITERIDIKNVTFSMSVTAYERAEHYLAQIKNPYTFICGGLGVNVVFNSTGKALVEVISSYLSSEKNR